MLSRENRLFITLAKEMESKGYERPTVPEVTLYRVFGSAEFAKADKLAFRYVVAFAVLAKINPNDSDFKLAHLSCRNRLCRDLIEIISEPDFCSDELIIPDAKEKEIYRDVKEQLIAIGVLDP